MKALVKTLGLSAIVLMAMVSCQQENQVPDNPTYDPVANTVNIKLVLDVSTGTGKDTKSTATYTQDDGTFLGMDAVHLLTYNLDYAPSAAGEGPFFYKLGGVATRDYDLGELFDVNDVSSGNSSRALELSLPLETNALVLYGKTKKTTSNDLQGNVEVSGNPADLATIKFNLTPRLSSEDEYVGGTIVFSRILTGFLVAGLVNESTYWRAKTSTGSYVSAPTGHSNREYRFWWPINETLSLTKGDSSYYADGETQVSGGITYTCHAGSLTWKQLGLMYDYAHDGDDNTKVEDVAGGMALSGLGESLGEAYSALTNVKTQPVPGSSLVLKELRAGCASGVLRTMQDLYAIVSKASTANPTTWEEEAARQLALEITRRMKQFFNTSGNTITGYLPWSTIKEQLESSIPSTEWAAYSTQINKVTSSFFTTSSNIGFPVNIGLPQGAAILKSETHRLAGEIDVLEKFEYDSNIPAYGMGDATFSIFNYRYPAELMYYGNSPIRVSDDVLTQAEYPNETTLSDPNAWTKDANWDSSKWTKNGQVKSTTRSVAMIKRLNYGTALLQSNVQYSSGALSNGLQDNKHGIFESEANDVIAVGPGITQGLKVTGIVIGGQPDTVGWGYTRKPVARTTPAYDATNKLFTGLIYEQGTSKNLFDKMIYDKVNPAIRVADPAADNRIYTLCWDNYDATLAADAQSDVYVALEMVNDTGHDFWGELNLVRNGGTFYLVGKLDLKKLKEASNATYNAMLSNLSRSDYNYPPYDPTTGATINAPRVFMQDYKTLANLIIDETSLQHAYVTVPDLRSSQVSLGLSIDLLWTPGLSFDVEMGKL